MYGGRGLWSHKETNKSIDFSVIWLCEEYYFALAWNYARASQWNVCLELDDFRAGINGWPFVRKIKQPTTTNHIASHPNACTLPQQCNAECTADVAHSARTIYAFAIDDRSLCSWKGAAADADEAEDERTTKIACSNSFWCIESDLDAIFRTI